jgi:dolichol-phosphate mannosyltransferase
MSAESPRGPEVDFVIPVFNEGENIESTLAALYGAVPLPKRVLIVFDFDEDETLPVVRAIAHRYPGLELVKNELGRGVLNAMRAGIDAARAPVVIITMADLSDDVSVAPRMVELITKEGFDVVCASRYMPGGRQIGGPVVKRTLSRLAGLSLHWLTGIGTHDVTNSFRAYRTEFLRQVRVESQGGFELALELTAKAHVLGRRVTEVPATWRDRTAGQSRFRLAAWIPHYMRWYVYVLRHGRRR